MTKEEIITELGKGKIVEKIASKFADGEYIEDLAQTIYITMLNDMDEEFIQGLWDKGEINYFIVGMARKLVLPESPWFKEHKRFLKKCEPIEEYNEQVPEYETNKYTYDITLEDALKCLTDYELELVKTLSQVWFKDKEKQELAEKYGCNGYKIMRDYESALQKLRIAFDGHMYRPNKKQSRRNTYTKKRITKKVYQFTKDGIFIREWASATTAGMALGIASQSITRCCHNNGINKSAGGYKWTYQPPQQQ